MKSTQLTSRLFLITILFIGFLTGCSKDTDNEMQPQTAREDQQVIRKNFATRQELDNYLKRTKKFGTTDTVTERTIIASSAVAKFSPIKSSSSSKEKVSSLMTSTYDEVTGIFELPPPGGYIAWTFNFPIAANEGFPSRLLCNGSFHSGGGTFYNGLFVSSEIFPGPTSTVTNNWTYVLGGSSWVIYSNHSFVQELTIGPVEVFRRSFIASVTIQPVTSQPGAVQATIVYTEVNS
ncbi:hypothetical protein [Pedobacter africanus]|uniref:Lipoprotein n=1 Tax=Pedobacter africanus TaxID=151894 RepID=A0A1W1ZAL3_9SPHI|nr:hypothetical protein [Pedobacter africanus]SMC45480.1 hypothetical protein SAMN04488524_0541 [Pedobacter africanus]